MTEKDFSAMVRQHQEAIYTVCLMYAADSDEANDLMQECLIRLWQNIQSFRGEAALSSWIYRVCMNTCITLANKEKRHKQQAQVPASELLTSNTAHAKQVQMLHQRLRRLGPFDRAIVLLWLEDMTYEEIGQIVGITAKNVSVRLVRIREELKQMTD